MQHGGSSGGSCTADADISFVQVGRHIVAHKIEQPRRAEVKADQRLQRQPRQRRSLQLACKRIKQSAKRFV